MINAIMAAATGLSVAFCTICAHAQQVVVPRTYGAIGNGVTDDTAAMIAAGNAAIASNRCLYLGNRKYKITATLPWFVTGRTISVCVYGDVAGYSNAGAQIIWAGSSSGPAIKVSRAVNFTLKNFHLRNAVVKGNSVGILFTSELVGSHTGPGYIERISVDGFYENVNIGESGGQAADTLSFNSVLTTNATGAGIAIRAANSLDINFYNLGMSGNAVGLMADESDSIYIHGGTATANTITDFRLGSAGSFGIFGFRSEGSNRFLLCGISDASTNVIVNGVTVNPSSNADKVLIGGLNGACAMQINSSTILGRIRPSNGGTALAGLVMTNNVIQDTAPFDPSMGDQLRYSLTGNNQIDAKGLFVSRFLDASGIVIAGVRRDELQVTPCAVETQVPCTAPGTAALPR